MAHFDAACRKQKTETGNPLTTMFSLEEVAPCVISFASHYYVQDYIIQCRDGVILG